MRKNPFISLFAASLIAFLPVRAMAQEQTQDTREDTVSVRNRERPEYAPQGARLGSFNFNAGLDLAVTSNDNLFVSRPELAVDEIYYEATPRASLVSDWSRHALAIDGAWTARRHDSETGEDTDSHFLRATGRLDVSSDTAIHASVRTAHQVTPRTDPDVSDTSGAPVEYDRLDRSIGVSQRFAQFTLRADAGQSSYDYQRSQRFRDHDETFVRGRIEAELSPRTGLVLQATGDERDYTNTPMLSSNGRLILGGLSLSTDLMRGELLLGQFSRDYDDPTIGTVDGLAGSANVEWYITNLTTVSFDARRNAEDQVSGTSGQPYVTTEYGARIDHELQRNIILTAGYRRGERSYDPLPRRDDYTEYEIGADYLINRHASLTARYTRDEIDYSRVSIDDRDVDAVTVGLSLSL
ncbi:MAG: outer membrane beta-barrel protein [Hyphomonadaceae bacterium]